MKITVYDKPEFNDRYTIIIDRCSKDFPKEMWGMTNQGSWYFSSDSRDNKFSIGKHLGKRISMDKLPVKVQKSIFNLALFEEL